MLQMQLPHINVLDDNSIGHAHVFFISIIIIQHIGRSESCQHRFDDFPLDLKWLACLSEVNREMEKVTKTDLFCGQQCVDCVHI